MTVSLMSILGGGATVFPKAGGEAQGMTGFLKANGEAQGVIGAFEAVMTSEVTMTGEAAITGETAMAGAFEAVMTGAAAQEVSTNTLNRFFVSKGMNTGDMLKAGNMAITTDMIARLGMAEGGKKLPGGLIVTLQSMLPQEVVDSVEQTLAGLNGETGAELLSALPKRELTPDELSEIVSETGLPPIVIFAALQDTPTASPNLAFAMVDNMGAAEADAGLPLPRGSIPAEISMQDEMDFAAEMGNAIEQGMLGDANLAEMEKSKMGVLKKIVDTLGSQNIQPNLTAAMAQAANNNEKMAATTKFTPTSGDIKAEAFVPASPDMGNNSQLSDKNGAAGAAAIAQQSAQTGDAQPTGFAAKLEQEITVRGAAKAVETHLFRHAAETEGSVTDQVAVRLRQATEDSSSSLEIRLKPHELGRVEVKIETGQDGKAHVTVTADKADTLDMLQKDVRTLERALSDAGVKTESNSLSFNLRGDQNNQQQARNGQQQNDQRGKGEFSLNGSYRDMDEKMSDSEMALTYDVARAYRLNLDLGLDISV